MAVNAGNFAGGMQNAELAQHGQQIANEATHQQQQQQLERDRMQNDERFRYDQLGAQSDMLGQKLHAQHALAKMKDADAIERDAQRLEMQGANQDTVAQYRLRASQLRNEAQLHLGELAHGDRQDALGEKYYRDDQTGEWHTRHDNMNYAARTDAASTAADARRYQTDNRLPARTSDPTTTNLRNYYSNLRATQAHLQSVIAKDFSGTLSGPAQKQLDEINKQITQIEPVLRQRLGVPAPPAPGQATQAPAAAPDGSNQFGPTGIDATGIDSAQAPGAAVDRADPGSASGSGPVDPNVLQEAHAAAVQMFQQGHPEENVRAMLAEQYGIT